MWSGVEQQLAVMVVEQQLVEDAENKLG